MARSRALNRSNICGRYDRYAKAHGRVLALNRVYEMILDEMKDDCEEEWKGVRNGNLDARREVVEKWTTDVRKVKEGYEEDVERVDRNAGLQGNRPQRRIR